MKILYVHAKGEIGGSDISLLTILKNINKKLFSPNVIVAKRGPFFEDYKKFSDKCEEVKISVFKSPDNLIELLKIILWFIPSIFLIWNKIRKWKIDLVHVNTIVIPSAIIAGKLARKPVIVHKREIIVSNKFADTFLDWITSRFADKIIVISKEVKVNSLKSLQQKAVVIYNGVDISEIPVERQNKLRRAYKIPKNSLLIGIFSRIEPWKGQDVVIRAMPKVLEKSENVRLLVYGSPYTQKGKIYFEKLKKLVKELNLEEHVMFMGTVKNINKIYNEFDLVILPSLDPEPLGRVLIEAMAAGRAVIAMNLGGSRECIVNNKTGLLIKENDVNAMVTAVLKLLDDADIRKTFGTLGRKRVEAMFNMKWIIKDVENVYQSLYNA